jgi:hypothetical protein
VLAVVLIFGFTNEKLKMKKVMMNIINWIMKILEIDYAVAYQNSLL